MVHGKSVEECEEILAAISRTTGVTEDISLSSTREYKKTRTKFYTPAFAEWEAKYMPQPETVPAT
jgi:hypothetical protein